MTRYLDDPRAYWEARHLEQGPGYVGQGDTAGAQRQAFWAALAPHLRPHNTLDLGCGTGRFTGSISTAIGPAHYYGVDHNRHAVYELNRHIHTTPLGANPRLSFSTGLPPRRSVRQLIAITVLQHVPDRDLPTLVTRLRSCLVSRGRRVLLIEDANPEHARPAPHMTFRTPGQYADLFGLRIAHFAEFSAERPLSHYLLVLE